MSGESDAPGAVEGTREGQASGDASKRVSDASREAPPLSEGEGGQESRTPPGDATIERWAERISASLKDTGGAAQDDGEARRAQRASESRTQTTDRRASEGAAASPTREAGSQAEARIIEQSGEAGAVGEVAADAPERARRRTVSVVQESVRPRVEKLRDASMGMIEEASEDTGLRFVLIAFALFLIFVLLLMLHSVLE